MRQIPQLGSRRLLLCSTLLFALTGAASALLYWGAVSLLLRWGMGPLSYAVGLLAPLITGGGIALSVSFIVTEGPYKGRYAFTSYGLSKNGLPFFKGFLQMIQLPLTKLSELEKALPLFPGHMCVIDVRPDRKNPQYTMTYVDRYLGMGNVADYLKPPAQPAAQDDLIPVDEPDDFPFN